MPEHPAHNGALHGAVKHRFGIVEMRCRRVVMAMASGGRRRARLKLPLQKRRALFVFQPQTGHLSSATRAHAVAAVLKMSVRIKRIA